MKGAHARIRAVLRNRDRPASGDIVYRTYLSIMLAISILAPLVRGAVLWLAEVIPAGNDPQTLQLWWGGALALMLFLPIAGWYFSPIRASLPELDLLFTSALSRWRLLAGRFFRAGIFSLLAGAAVAGLLIGARMIQGEPVRAVVSPVLLSGALVGLSAYFLLLLGQLCRGTRWQALREQAERLDAVSTLVVTGEFRSAAGRIGAPVKLGRNWGLALHWIQRPRTRRGAAGRGAVLQGTAERGLAQSGLPLFMLRDCIGVLRTPLRSIAGLLGTVAAGAITGLVLVTQGSCNVAVTGVEGVGGNGDMVGNAVLGAAALLLAYTSIGPWCRGLRTAGGTIGASPLLPYSALGLLLRHLLVPALLSALLCIGSSISVTFILAGEMNTHLSPAVVSTAVIAGLVLSLIAVSLRLLGSLKGPLPQSLLAPIPTPAGDLSAINVMLWNLDGPILAATIGAGLLAVAVVSPLVSLVSAAVVVAVLLLWSNIRLQRHD